MQGLSLVVASGDHSSSQCAGLSLSRPLLLWSTGSRRAGSVIVAHRPSCSAACGILPDQGSNPCPLHWQADSQTLRHQGSPGTVLLISTVSQGDMAPRFGNQLVKFIYASGPPSLGSQRGPLYLFNRYLLSKHLFCAGPCGDTGRVSAFRELTF